MNKFSSYSIKKPITIIMAVLIIIILGFVSLTNTKTDLLPSMNLPYAVVSTSYVGASPDEVELMVTKPIESSIATVSNIKNIRSVSQENMSMVILEFNEDTNMDSALIEMRENLDMVTSYMPNEVGSPMIMKINPDMMPIMSFSMSVEDKSVLEMSNWMDSVIPRFERIPGVASVSLLGNVKEEVRIRLSDDKIEEVNEKMKELALEEARKQVIDAAVAKGMSKKMAEKMAPTEIPFPGIEITKDMVSGVIKGQNFNMPAGYINDAKTDYLVRTGDKIKDLDAIKTLPIMVTELMTVTLEDVADVNVVDGSGETYSKVNGKNAITVSVQKQNNATTTEVAKLVQEEFNKVTEEYDDVEIVTLMNQAEYIDKSISSVTNNLLYGALLAVFILIVFLRDLKPTIIIALAIPISVMTAFIMIYFAGISLNIISMGGLALGIGMLVDNSIVVIENIYRLRNDGVSVKEAALKGASQVAGAITASTLTTISVFVPVVFMKGFTAQIFMEMALTISFSLIASLVIALTLVPMMSSKIMVKSQINREHKVLDGIKRVYTNALRFSLKHKVVVVLLALILFVGSIFGSVKVGTELFPESDQGQIVVNVTLPSSGDFQEVVQTIDEISEKISGIEDVETVSGTISDDVMMRFAGGGSDSATINVLLSDDRTKATKEVSKEIREATKDYEYEISVTEQGMDMSAMGGSGISISIKGYEMETLESIAKDLTQIVEDTEGTTETDSGVSKTSPELKITVDREKSIEKGLTTAQVYMAVREAISSDEKVSTITLKGNEADIYVLEDADNEEEMDIEAIKNFTLESPMGGEVKVSDIADVSVQSGFAKINRNNQSRTLTVTSAIKDGYNIGLVSNKIEEKIDDYEVPDGYIVEVKGENEQIKDSFIDLMKALLLAIVLIYMIMASQFQSLRFPFIVMFSLPLAFTGGFLALIITNTPISMVAFIGMIILAGVVVNNGIVLVDYINQLKDQGESTYDAIIEAGNTRLRPIIMTALTTILALTTMALGVGEGAEMMQPMAITAIGGLIYATVLTLIIVPIMYSAFDRKGKKASDR